jgi:hypothetical protein
MSRYATAAAFRIALEDRLKQQATTSGVRLDRLRRHVMFERFLARVEATEPGEWILKGAVALELRLGDHARATADIDLGLRAESVVDPASVVADRLDRILGTDVGDFFQFRLRNVERKAVGGASDLGRARVAVSLAGREFGGFRVDVALRTREVDTTERLVLPCRLGFAGIEPPEVEVVTLPRHVAEKFAGMLQTFPDRENTRVRDLVDLVLLAEHDLLNTVEVAPSVRAVWEERAMELSADLPPLPAGWPPRYEALASEYGLDRTTFPEAVDLMRSIWVAMFPPAEE